MWPFTRSKLHRLQINFAGLFQVDSTRWQNHSLSVWYPTSTVWQALLDCDWNKKKTLYIWFWTPFFYFFSLFSFVCIFLLFLLINYMYLMRKGIGKKITKIQKRFRLNLKLKKEKKKWEIPFYHINLRKPSSPNIKNMDEN